MTLFEKSIFPLFGIGAIAFYYSLYKTYKYTKQKGYRPDVPIGNSELFKFIAFCSKKQKQHDDIKLKKHILSMNLTFGFCFLIFMIAVLKY